MSESVPAPYLSYLLSAAAIAAVPPPNAGIGCGPDLPFFFSPPSVSSVRHSNATESQMLQLAHLPPESGKFVAGGVGGKMCSFVTRDVYCIN